MHVSTARPDQRADISEHVTVFVSTVGAPSFQACLDHLTAQDRRFGLEIVDHVAPRSAALQQMIDRCRTPFYVQVDEDMLLAPTAIGRLYDAMSATDGDVAIVQGMLWDAHLGRPIHGLKIFRHDVACRYPWTDHPVVIMRLQRMADDGFTTRLIAVADAPDGVPRIDPRVVTDPSATFGVHAPSWTPETIFERYATVERRRHAHSPAMGWADDLAATLLARFRSRPTELDFFALMGLLHGASAGPLLDVPGEDDRTRAGLRGLAGARSAWFALGSPGLTDHLGLDLRLLLAGLSSPVVQVEDVTGLPSAVLARTTMRVALADGRVVKARQMDDPVDVERVMGLAGLLDPVIFAVPMLALGSAMIEPWVVGVALGEGPSEVALETLGRALGALHRQVAPHGVAARSDSRTPAVRLALTIAALERLQAAGAISDADRGDLVARAQANVPARIEVGPIHRDLAPENVVITPDGKPMVVDNAMIDLGALDADLARTAYRWPMDGAARAAFEVGYEEQRSASAFRQHRDFWMIATLADAAVFRSVAAPSEAHVPLDALRALARARQAVEGDFSWSGYGVAVRAPDAATMAWLESFLRPWFESTTGVAASAGVSLTMDRHLGRRIEALRRRRGDETLPAFGLDSRVISLPVWHDEHGARVALDVERKLLFTLGADAPPRITVTAASDTLQARMGLMRVIRELAIGHALARGERLVHAAAVTAEGRVILFGGPKAAGKTSLLLHALRARGVRYVANDRVMIRVDRQRLIARGMPSLVSIRPGTTERFRALPDLGTDLTPGAFCDALGVEAEAGGEVAAVILPSIDRHASGLAFVRLGPGAATTAIDALRFGPQNAEDLLFRALARAPSSDPPAPDPPAPDPAAPGPLAVLASSVPWYRAHLGPDAFDGDPSALLALLGVPVG
ncbi:MAG: hypothetical protein ABIZ34_09780 [Candidatus Limnocylindrales bacterium]